MSVEDLPKSSGAFTRALEAIFDTEGRYGHLVGRVREIGYTVAPDDWVPWLIYDLGLEDVIPFVRTFAQVLAEGPNWQTKRGTPSGIEIGIGWVESKGTVAPPDGRHPWWEFQIGFEAPATDIQQIRQLDGIVRLSKASEDDLFRMFSPAADFRPVRMDMHRADEGLMDGYSGEALWPGGPLIAFGWAGDTETIFENAVHGAAEILVSTEFDRDEGLRFDEGSLDDGRPIALTEYGADLEHTTEAEAFVRDIWPSRWPRSWLEGAQPSVATSPWETT